MAVIKSGASSDQLTVDTTSKAARVTLYTSAGKEVSPQSKATFYASGTFTPAATPTDLVTIFGSASKTVRVIAMVIGTTNTAAGSQQFFLIKRSSANSGGTPVAATLVQADSTDPAATATVQHYTANPAALGTSAGTINTVRVASPVAVAGSFAGVMQIAEVDMLRNSLNAAFDKSVVLNGTAQGLCINFNGVALVAGQTHYYNVIWIEE
jgi:hypothetical protein